MSIGNGGKDMPSKERRGRLPEKLDELLADLVVRQYQITQAAERIYDLVDSDTARAIKALIETIIENAEQTRTDLIDETGLLRELMKELRDLREDKKNGNGH